MRKKRIGVIVATLMFTILTGGTSVLAYTSAAIKHPHIDVNLNGYIDFLDGPLLLPDKIWYYGLLSGSDITVMANRSSDTRATITPGTNKKTLSTITLFDGRKRVSMDDISCGIGGSYGQLQMICGGKKKQ